MIPSQLLRYIIQPALAGMGAKYNKPGADVLLLATGAQESHCGEYVKQIGGPALGWPQIEPFTHRQTLCWAMTHAPHVFCRHDSIDARLIYDFCYATKVARLIYYSWPDPLPPVECDAMFAYYKEKYNSTQGAATLEQWRENWARYVQPVLS